MVDATFIEERIVRGKQAIRKVEYSLANLTLVQLNWKPSVEIWSIAECLQHLIIAQNAYFKDMSEISNGTYRMSMWEKYSPFSGVCGSVLKKLMQEHGKRKIATNQALMPSISYYHLMLLDQYTDCLTQFMNLVKGCKQVDIDKTIINSPTIPWITYSLRDALYFIFEHEHRHINQAVLVTKNPNFPQGKK